MIRLETGTGKLGIRVVPENVFKSAVPVAIPLYAPA